MQDPHANTHRNWWVFAYTTDMEEQPRPHIEQLHDDLELLKRDQAQFHESYRVALAKKYGT